MRVLGIDPGYARTGYGLLDQVRGEIRVLDYGLIQTAPELPFPERLLSIHQALSSIIARHQPTCMAIEELFFSRNTTTAMGTAQARGVAIVCGAAASLQVFEYTPMQVKLAVTGYGRADKQQVQEMIRRLLRLRQIPRPDDAADALAVALCHAHCGNRTDTLAVGGYQ